jgi:hypothetical protein
MSRVKAALAGGLVLTAVAIALTLLHSPATIASTNEAGGERESLATVEHGTRICQRDEYVPRGTTAIQPKLGANTGPRMRVEVQSDGQVLTSGQRGSGWTGRIVTIPVTLLKHSVSDATVCVSFAMHDETISIYGSPATGDAEALEGKHTLGEKMWINYLGTAERSWASQLGSIAEHMELGRTSSGAWIVLLVLVLAAGVVALSCTLVLRELR